MLNDVAETIGGVFMLAGAFALAALILGFLVQFAGEVWISASRKWRNIFKAERLICEYKREREQYLKWRELNLNDKQGIHN